MAAAADPSSSLLWTLILLVTALCLALVVCTQILGHYSVAYMAAPHEIVTFIDAVDFSIQENESYDRDVARVPRLEDKMRLGRLLREIQKGGDDLREDLNRLLASEGGTSLKASARALWASHRRGLEERVRRLDILRMRFLVVYMGIIATPPAGAGTNNSTTKTPPKIRDPEKAERREPKMNLRRSLTDEIHRKPPLRRLTTQAMGHSEKTETPTRMGWMGVVAELQRSPLMHKRHASIESAMQSPPPMSPLSSPLAEKSMSPSEGI